MPSKRRTSGRDDRGDGGIALSRRGLLKTSSALGVGLAAPTIVPASVLGAAAPSEGITVGCIGVGRMGMDDQREALGLKPVQVVAVCDVDSNRVKNAQKAVESYHGEQGVVFEGSDGWAYVRRGHIEAEPASLLAETVGPDETKLYVSNHHKANFYECVRSRAESVAPVEVAHRLYSVCLLGQTAMRLGRKLRWDPEAERFVGDAGVNRMLSKPMRGRWRL